MDRPVYDRIYQHLFDDKDDSRLSARDYRVKERMQAAFIKKISHPTIQDKNLAKMLMDQFGISLPQAYNDIAAVERIFGDVRKSNKEYIRMIVTENMKQVVDVELKRLRDSMSFDKDGNLIKAGEYSQKDLISALATMAKVNNVDKEDVNTPNWSEIQPPIIEPTDDITVLDLEDIPDENVNKIRERYLARAKQIKLSNED